MQTFANDLLDYLDSRAGAALRCVATYDDYSYDVLQVRDDIDRAEIRKRAEEVHSNLTSAGQKRESHLQRDLGEIRASLHLRKHAVILHFPRGDGRGVIVSLETDAARDLGMFVDECLRQM